LGLPVPFGPSPVIPTEATQFSLPISLPVRWLGYAVEGPLFSSASTPRKNYCANDVIPAYERYYKHVLAES
jgi:hypothetical protein